MNSRLFLFLVIFVFSFFSCLNSHYDKKAEPKPVSYSVLNRSNYFNKNNISFSIDSLNNILFAKLSIKELKNFPFPINSQYHDTLFKTAFTFDFYCNNKIITSDYHIFKNTFRYYTDTLSTAKNLSLTTDTIDLRKANELQIQIPFYAFHNLKKGKQIIEIAMSQTTFTDEVRVMNHDSSYSYKHILAVKPLMNARVKFEMNVPEIFKSIIYGRGLVLRNDSTFSPAGMDNTLWKSSYPDIYWTINYPKNEYYVQTTYEPCTDRYTKHDTFNLYHYSTNDSIGFDVFDHDDLSRDDFLGSWWGSLNDLEKKEYKRLKFDNVQSFDLSVKAIGVINK